MVFYVLKPSFSSWGLDCCAPTLTAPLVCVKHKYLPLHVFKETLFLHKLVI